MESSSPSSSLLLLLTHSSHSHQLPTRKMPRSRLGKRSSSSSSYTSTITIVAFIALCIIGVWMLTSNSVIPPQTTTRIAKDAAAATDSDVSSSSNVRNTEPGATKDSSTVYEDNPGDLPDDAIKSDDPKTIAENDKDQTRDNKQEKNEDEKNKGAEQETVTEENTKGSTEDQVGKESQATEDGASSQNQQADQGNVDSTSTQDQGNQEIVDNKSTQDQDSQGREDSTSTQNQQPDKENQGSSESEGNQQTSNSGDGAIEQTAVAESVDNPQKTNGDQQQNKEQQQQEDTNSQDSKNQAAKVDQQQPLLSTQNNKQEPQNEKQYEIQQIEQRLEDAGIQNTTQEPPHVLSDEDSKQRIQEQKMQQQQQQNPSKDTQQSDTKATQDAETQTEKQETATGDSAFPGDANTGIPKESKESKKAWSTQVTESENQKERRKDETDSKEYSYGYTWQLCNVTAGTDYIPCLDNEKAIKQLRSTRHFEHRERHCPTEGPTCLVTLPQGYKRSIKWPQSRDKIWYHNVPHTKLAEVKGHQNWVKVTGEFLTFPGGGTQFIHGALHYIDFVEQAEPKIGWGKHTRVILDVGCGVASFGGFLFEKDVLAMSFAPKDEHEAQVQFALERGIPAISAVMGSQRLQFPSRVFDLIHCARCRVPWHVEGGKLLLELNRVLRPGGYFVWSATPVYQKLQEDVEIWKEMSALTISMCWDLVTIKKDKLNSIAAAIYRKPTTNDCYDKRKKNIPPMCQNDDDPNAAWYVPLQACMHRVPVDKTERGTEWPKEWPLRLQTPPYWLNSSQMGIYGKPAPEDFARDYQHWKHLVHKSYMKGLGISWSNVRNVMDMRAVYGGFAAALKDLKVWVMNIVNVDSPDTLPIIFERGLFGMYHDWCESFSTYPRTYDLLHADHLFSKLKKRCRLEPVMAEVDRILRPGGKLIVRDESTTISEVENLLKSLRWEVHLTFSKDKEGMLSAQKGDWRPEIYAVPS